jgi:hypothetical protein
MALPWRVLATKQHGDLVDAEPGGANREEDHVRSREDGLDSPLGRAEQQQADVLQDERHPDRADQGRQPRGVPERSVRETLDARVDRRCHEHDDRQGEERQQQRQQARRGDAQTADDQLGREIGECRAEHEDIGVGEVDELEDPVDEGVTDRDQRDDQAVGDADRQRLDQFLHALSS